MPNKAKPPIGTTNIAAITILVVIANGRQNSEKSSTGADNNTASTNFLNSNKPSTLPASVKFAGIYIVIGSKKILLSTEARVWD
jgi:hypothetical protein